MKLPKILNVILKFFFLKIFNKFKTFQNREINQKLDEINVKINLVLKLEDAKDHSKKNSKYDD